MKVKRIFLLIFLSFQAKIFALDTLVNEIGDDSALRQRFAKTIFIDPPASVLGKKNTIERLESGERVEIRIEREKNNDEFSIILAREYAGKFPGWAQGSFIITRNARTGAADRIRIFLRSDPYTYIQFRPLNAAKSEMDVVVYDAFLSQSTPLAFSMEKIAAMPLNAVLDSLGAKFPRRYFVQNSPRTLMTGHCAA